ncbi:retrovirus-related pol polyprotein from transposon TNT 1-94 [Tanacetum coccineum]
MAREAEVKRVFNTGNGVAKPVWTNANRVNHANKFVPRSVQLNAGRPNFNSVRPNINTGRTNINSVRPKVNACLSLKLILLDLDSQRPFAKTTAQMSHSNAVMGIWGSAVKTSASYNWRNSEQTSNYNIGPTFNRLNAKGPLADPCLKRTWVNQDQLDAFENSMDDVPNFVGILLASKDETSGILQTFIRQIENQLSHRVKIIRSDNGTEFKNRDILEFCGNKGIKQEYSNWPELHNKMEIYEDEGVITDFNSLPIEIESHPNPTLRIHSIHLRNQILGDPKSAVQTRSKVQNKLGAHALLNHIQKQQRNNHKINNMFCLSCFSIQEEPKKILKHNKIQLGSSHAKKNYYSSSHNKYGSFITKMMVKVLFLYGTIDEEVYVTQPPSFVDPDHPTKEAHFGEKIHTDLTVADSVDTIPIDGPRFNYLVVSIGFAEIVDFLRGSNIRYALTSNPTIYDSLVKQFWQTATANTIADGTLEIKATIDTIGYTITEASIRDTLPLEDATGITMLPNAELFEGMGQMGTELMLWTHTLSSTTLPLISQESEERWEGFLQEGGNMVFISLEEEVPEHQGREIQDDPLDSLVQGLVTPSTSKVNASGEEQVEDISPNTLWKQPNSLREGGINTGRVLNLVLKLLEVKGTNFTREASLLQSKSDGYFAKEEVAKQVHLDSLLAQRIAEEEELNEQQKKRKAQVESFAPINFEATKASLKRFGEELQTKTSKRLKSDEAKDVESTKKSGKRRKQMARKGLHKDLDKDDSEDSDEVS